ncbi:hypothetical protein Bbelb_004160 [Branchiostoma belcheri]|nr:hypothetical protein Bbelb_004160 [Branchiostoma belcheri]
MRDGQQTTSQHNNFLKSITSPPPVFDMYDPLQRLFVRATAIVRGTLLRGGRGCHKLNLSYRDRRLVENFFQRHGRRGSRPVNGSCQPGRTLLLPAILSQVHLVGFTQAPWPEGVPAGKWELPAGLDAAPPRYSLTSSPGGLHTGTLASRPSLLEPWLRTVLPFADNNQVCFVPVPPDTSHTRYNPTPEVIQSCTTEQPMPARLLNPAGASRGYIPDGHRPPMDNIVTEKQLDWVADNVSPCRSRRLLRELGLKDATIDQVFHDFETYGIQEKLYQGLRKCKEHKGSGFTLCELVKALENIGRADLIDNFPISDLQSGLTKSDTKLIQSVTEERMRNKRVEVKLSNLVVL